jgi:photosystem II stability/assembly factor-like uncharacterized protein
MSYFPNNLFSNTEQLFIMIRQLLSATIFCIVISFLQCNAPDSTPSTVSGAYEALNWFARQRAYPAKDIPRGAYLRANERRKQLLQATNRSHVTPWESRGPWNTAGRTLALAFNPQNDRTLYAGSASGGLWRSYAQGEGVSWERVPLGFPVLGVSSIAFAPNDSMTIYIGTGEVYNFAAAGTGAAYRSTRGTYGVGILKSVDGGVTWTKVLDTPYQEQMGVWAVRVAESNPDHVYAATTHGVYISEDAGQTWDQRLDVVMATDIVISPDDENLAIVGCGNFGSDGRGIYRTTDGGLNWTQATDIINAFNGKIQLAMYQNDPDIVYASIGNGFGFDDGASWLWRSEDGGASWTLRSTEDYSRWQGWFAHDVAISPDDPDVITVIGIDVWHSDDGGTTLNKITFGGIVFGTPPIGEPEDTTGLFSHSDHHEVIYHPTNPDIILLGNDGGVNRSTDGGVSYATVNGGYQTTQFYNGFSVSPIDPEFTMGGLQDNSTIIYTGDEAWRKTFGGDGSWTAMHSYDPEIVFASSQNLNMGISGDGGLNWTGIAPPHGNGATAFIAPYVISPSDPEIIYAGRATIYKTVDLGATWEALNGPLNGDPAFSMAISPYNSDVCYVGLAPLASPASVWVTQDGASWTDISSGLPDRFPTDLAVDPMDHATAYCTFSGFGTGHLFKTEDFGASWTDISTSLPDIPGQSVIVDPLMEDHIYYGDDFGVYFSPDGGVNWESFSDGLPEAVIAMDLKISPQDRMLWIATHGNGTYRTDLVPVSTAVDEVDDVRIGMARIFPNPNDGHFNIETDGFDSGIANVSVYGQSGRTIWQQDVMIEPNIKIDLAGEGINSGIYFISLKQSDRMITKRLVISN